MVARYDGPFSDTGLLYLSSASPYRWIQVEIDAVEGAEPPPMAIEGLREFLQTSCRKPVHVIRKPAIPREQARGQNPYLVALQNLCGPDGRPDAGPPAYVYVLFYDGELIKGTGVRWTKFPHVYSNYPCAIYVDISYLRPGFEREHVLPAVLKHEAGHLLGLAENANHCDDGHCRQEGCILYETIPADETRLPQALCDECRADLAAMRRMAPPDNLHFVGPALVRQEQGYYVTRLPACRHLDFGLAAGFNLDETLPMLRHKADQLRDSLNEPAACLVSRAHPFRSPADVRAWQGAIRAALRDPDARIAQTARELIRALEAEFGLSLVAHQRASRVGR